MIKGMHEFDLVMQLRSGGIGGGVALLRETSFLVAATGVVVERDEVALRAFFPADRRGTTGSKWQRRNVQSRDVGFASDLAPGFASRSASSGSARCMNRSSSVSRFGVSSTSLAPMSSASRATS